MSAAAAAAVAASKVQFDISLSQTCTGSQPVDAKIQYELLRSTIIGDASNFAMCIDRATIPTAGIPILDKNNFAPDKYAIGVVGFDDNVPYMKVVPPLGGIYAQTEQLQRMVITHNETTFFVQDLPTISDVGTVPPPTISYNVTSHPGWPDTSNPAVQGPAQIESVVFDRKSGYYFILVTCNLPPDQESPVTRNEQYLWPWPYAKNFQRTLVINEALSSASAFVHWATVDARDGFFAGNNNSLPYNRITDMIILESGYPAVPNVLMFGYNAFAGDPGGTGTGWVYDAYQPRIAAMAASYPRGLNYPSLVYVLTGSPLATPSVNVATRITLAESSGMLDTTSAVSPQFGVPDAEKTPKIIVVSQSFYNPYNTWVAAQPQSTYDPKFGYGWYPMRNFADISSVGSTQFGTGFIAVSIGPVTPGGGLTPCQTVTLVTSSNVAWTEPNRWATAWNYGDTGDPNLFGIETCPTFAVADAATGIVGKLVWPCDGLANMNALYGHEMHLLFAAIPGTKDPFTTPQSAKEIIFKTINNNLSFALVQRPHTGGNALNVRWAQGAGKTPLSNPPFIWSVAGKINIMLIAESSDAWISSTFPNAPPVYTDPTPLMKRQQAAMSVYIVEDVQGYIDRTPNGQPQFFLGGGASGLGQFNILESYNQSAVNNVYLQQARSSYRLATSTSQFGITPSDTIQPYIVAINDTMAAAWADAVDKNPSMNVYTYPYIQFDPTIKMFQMVYPPNWNTKVTTDEQGVVMNGTLWTLFQFMPKAFLTSGMALFQLQLESRLAKLKLLHEYTSHRPHVATARAFHRGYHRRIPAELEHLPHKQKRALISSGLTDGTTALLTLRGPLYPKVDSIANPDIVQQPHPTLEQWSPAVRVSVSLQPSNYVYPEQEHMDDQDTPDSVSRITSIDLPAQTLPNDIITYIPYNRRWKFIRTTSSVTFITLIFGWIDVLGDTHPLKLNPGSTLNVLLSFQPQERVRL